MTLKIYLLGGTLYDTNLKEVGHVLPSIQISNDTDHLTWLTLETILAGHSILIFCPSKAWVEKLSEVNLFCFENDGVGAFKDWAWNPF